MASAEAIFLCVLSALDPQVPKAQNCTQSIVPRVVDAIQRASCRYQVPPKLIAAVAYHESRFRPWARGSLGEVGLMQIKRDGAVTGRLLQLSDAALARVETNIQIGTAYLAKMSKQCPTYWLSRYNGRPCKPTSYSRGVLSALSKASEKLTSKRIFFSFSQISR